jgi:2',3'-cyclic-nucleotide 2'-phosphodiesterase (5'-nucleotidase family)
MIVSDNVLPRHIVEIGGIKVGLFGLTIDREKEERKTYPIDNETERKQIAMEETHRLRAGGADLVVALTHLRYQEDEELLRAPPPDRPDLIIGGHDHQHMVREIGGAYAYKADADAATATLLLLTRDISGAVKVSYRLETLDTLVAEDPQVQARVGKWLDLYDRQECARRGLTKGCLATEVATTNIALEGDEMKIRSRETDLGDIVADAMVAAVKRDCKTEPGGIKIDGAFINAGSLRLNSDLPAGARLTLGTIDDLLPFSTELHFVKLSAAKLQEIMEHAFIKRNTGGWLQISGMKVRFDPDGSPHIRLQRGGPGKWVDLDPKDDAEQYNIVSTEFLIDKGGDDYQMLRGAEPVNGSYDKNCTPDLKSFLQSKDAFPGKTIRPPQDSPRIQLPGVS